MDSNSTGTNSVVSAAIQSSNNDLIIAKVVAMLVLGLSSFALGVLPSRLTKLMKINTAMEGDKNFIISLFLCFGGGVLLFTTFIHLQPEVREAFGSLQANGAVPSMSIPISELVFCAGFFFVYLVEEAVHLMLERKGDHEHDALQRSLSVRRYSTKDEPTKSLPTPIKADNAEKGAVNNNNHQHDGQGGHSHLATSIKGSLSGLLAVLALSFHAVFEGLAVGLETGVRKVWYLFAAIATHKLVIAFCVGVELVTSRTKPALLILYIGTFAIVTPLGICIGLILSSRSGAGDATGTGDVVAVCLQAMAAGTLLYVVFFEVLARERGKSHNGMCQLVAICAGFATMFVIQMLLGHDHDHSNGSSSGASPSHHSHSHDHNHYTIDGVTDSPHIHAH
nr:unnamed protein product [Callosobruchus chinensis]